MRTGSRHIGRRAGAALAAAVVALAGASAAHAKTPARDHARHVSIADGTATFVPGEVVVRFRAGASDAARQAALAEHGATVARRLAIPDAVVAKLPPGRSVRAAVAALEQRAAVRYAEPNLIRRPLAAPDDPRYANGDLWALNQPSDADIDAPEAWNATTGSGNVVVAVVDTGVAWDHPDLAPNIWSNPGEVPDGVDNDGNGKVDDVRGWDFVGNGTTPDNDPRDLNGHGTHVAGTIGAQGNNALGVVGVSWDVSIMPVRVLGPDGGTSADVAAGFAYAGAEGAKVVNASLGCSGAGCFSQIEKDAIDGAPGTLFVFAAGNDGTNNASTPTYPCGYASDNSVCVAATTRTDGLADFSNYGTNAVDLAAPGVGIPSTWLALDSVVTDDFETALPGRWTTGGVHNTWARHAEGAAAGAWGLTDSPASAYADGTDSFVARVLPFSLAGRSSCFVRYALALQTEWDFDYLVVDASTNNLSWTEVGAWTGETIGYPATKWTFEDDLSAVSGSPAVYLRFGLETDSSIVRDGIRLDSVDVRCPGSTYDADDYNTIDGTSMATPHVSGVAALAWAKNPGASVALVKQALLEGGDAVPSLGGKVATGRRLNAAGTLALVPPPIATPALSCGATAASAGAPTIRGNGPAFEYVFWRTIFWRFDGTTWQPSAAPWLWSYATAGVPTSEWRRLDDGVLLGTTGSVAQSQATSPPGGYWAATAEVYWLSQALQFAGHDHVLVGATAGSNAVAGTPICSWPGAQALRDAPAASDLRALRAPVAGVPSALARRTGRVLTG